MKRNEFIKALCNFQYWLHKEYRTISTSSVDMTERASRFVEIEGENLPIELVGNNEAAICEHEWIDITTIEDIYNKKFFCNKCGVLKID